MRRPGIWLVLCLAPVWLCHAQVTVEVTQEQDYFLPSETMPVTVRITNRSGQTLRLGEDPDWLTFAIEAQEGLVTPKVADPPVQGEFELPSSKAAVKNLDLTPYFPITQPGRYAIVATVRIKDWGQQVASKPRSFDVIQGAKLWEQDVGLPRTTNSTSAVPEIRKYVLQQANYVKSQIRLYVRVTDALGGRTFKVTPVGTMVSFSRPEVQIDEDSRLHLMYQRGPKAFTYAVFNTDGDIVTRQTYDYIQTRPRLKIDAASKIVVAGGTRRILASDIPPPVYPETTNAPAASLTNAPAASPTNALPAKKPSR